MGCIACGRGFPEECPDEGACSEPVSISFTSNGTETNIKEYKDESSTGRKQAAKLYPFICDRCGEQDIYHKPTDNCPEFRPRKCEWQGLANAGGGRNPIIGCSEGIQSDRHHGPVKRTVHNELGNVHRLCNTCHNRWHVINDGYYDQDEFAKLPHDPRPATDEEILENEKRWRMGWFKANYEMYSKEKVKED